MDHAFGRAAPFALGVEEELHLVEPDTFALAHGASALVPALRPAAGEVKYDTYEALVELSTPVSPSATEAARTLSQLRAQARAAGATLIGAGLHPTAAWGDVVHVPQRRYRFIADDTRGLLRRTPTAALHVHVGMPDPETAIRTYNHLRAHLPLLQALAANSPFWFGRDAGLCSARAVLFRGFPRAEVPRAFADWDDYAGTVSGVVAAGDLPDYTFLWWDIRPAPRLGTVEVRAMDAQSDLRAVAGLAALVRALARAAAAADAPAPSVSREQIAESSFRAARDGLRATLWHEGALRPVAEVARAALALARPWARAEGDERALGEIERILREGGGADRQRAAWAAGGLPRVLALLAEEAARPFA